MPYNPQQVVSGNPPTAERQQFVPYNPLQVVPYNSVLSAAVSQPMNALPSHPNIAHYAGYAHGFPVPHLQSSLRNDACGFYPSLGYQAHFGFIPNPSQIANGIHIHQFGGYIGGAMLHQHHPQLATVVHNHEHVTYNVNAPSTINHNLIPGCSNPPDANDDIVYDDPASDRYESLSSMNFPEVMSDDIDERLEVTGVFKSVETKEDDQKTDEESANEPTQGDYLSDRLEIREEVHQDAEAFEEEEELEQYSRYEDGEDEYGEDEQEKQSIPTDREIGDYVVIFSIISASCVTVFRILFSDSETARLRKPRQSLFPYIYSTIE